MGRVYMDRSGTNSMSTLSPAAQAVLDAFSNAACGQTYQVRSGIAAALCAAADQVVPDCDELRRVIDAAWKTRWDIRGDFLAIATEL